MVQPLLESVLGGGYIKSKGNIAFHCPFCNHRKKKLEVHPELQLWNCWVCGTKGKSIYSLFKRMQVDQVYFTRLASVLPKDDRSQYLIKNRNNSTPQVNVQLPKEFNPLFVRSNGFFYDTAHKYFIEQRKCTEQDLIKYNIGYADDGKFKNMLIFPNYDEFGNLDFFTTRSFMNNSAKKFVNASYDRNVIGFEMQLNWDLPLLICESALDAITLRINSSPMYGKTMSKKLKLAIFENEVSDIYLCLDPDAFKEQLNYIKYLISFGINVYHVQFPPKTDVNKLGYDTCWDIIKSTPKMTESSLFELEVFHNLNNL